MSNQVFQQNLDDKKGPQPGGPYLIQMLFKEPVPIPDKEKMTAVRSTMHWRSVLDFCQAITQFEFARYSGQLIPMKIDQTIDYRGRSSAPVNGPP